MMEVDAAAAPAAAEGAEKADAAAPADGRVLEPKPVRPLAQCPEEGEDEEKKAKEAKKGGDGADKKEPEPPEPSEEILSNPCRVLKAQMRHISFPKEIDNEPVRYAPLLGSRRVGFLLLSYSKPEEPEDLFLEEDKGAGADEKEPDPPAPFEWTDAD